MSATDERLDRIEQLLRDGNRLRAQAVALQEESIALQRSLIEEQRANLLKAGEVNEQALSIQQRARRIQLVVAPALALLLAYASWLLFFRIGV